MKPRMSDSEYRLFESFLPHADHYFEFGSGGSTYAASRLVKKSVTSVDSSQEWLDAVAAACAADACPIEPKLIHVDIGPIGEWGYPTDPATREAWPGYYESLLKSPSNIESDLFFVDGRFRVACFLITIRNCRPDAVIMIHDFASRPHYHAIRQVAREIASSDDLGVFVPLYNGNRALMDRLVIEYRFDAN